MRALTQIPNRSANYALSATLRDGFALALKGEGRAPKTRLVYLEALDQLCAFIQERGMPELPLLTAEHLREFLGSLYARGNKPATLSNRYRALSRFFRWLRDEGEVTESPMSRIKAPQVPTQVLPHYEVGEIEAMLRACDRGTLSGARDRAIILVLFDTGVRGGELVGLDGTAVDLKRGTALVRGKGGRERVVSIGSRTALALNRYLRLLQRERVSPERSALWVSQRSDRLTLDGLRMLLQRRARKASVRFKGIHAFRRTSAIAFLEAGGYPDDLQTLMGWQSAQMLRHYTRATATDRAVAAHKRLSPSDRLKV